MEEEGGGGRGGVVVVRALFPPCCVPRRARDALIARRWSRAREINGVRFRRAASRTDASLTTAASARTGWAASSEKSDRTTPALAVGSLSRSPPAHSRSPRSHFALRSVPFSRPHVRLRESSRAAWVGRRARGALSLARLGSAPVPGAWLGSAPRPNHAPSDYAAGYPSSTRFRARANTITLSLGESHACQRWPAQIMVGRCVWSGTLVVAVAATVGTKRAAAAAAPFPRRVRRFLLVALPLARALSRSLARSALALALSSTPRLFLARRRRCWR